MRRARRDEAPPEFLSQHDLVGAAQYLRRISRRVRKHPDRVACRRGRRGLVLTLSADVTDGDAPAAGSGVDVVEIAAHLATVSGRQMRRGHLDPWYRLQDRREQAGAERVSRLRSLPEHPPGRHGQAEQRSDLLDEPGLGDAELAVISSPDQGQDSEPARLVRHRDGQHRSAAQHRQQRRPIRRPAERHVVVDVRAEDSAAPTHPPDEARSRGRDQLTQLRCVRPADSGSSGPAT